LRGGQERTEVPDFKNGATKKTEVTKKAIVFSLETNCLHSVFFDTFVAPFLRSGTSVLSHAAADYSLGEVPLADIQELQ
jgi:hypothetical protein